MNKLFRTIANIPLELDLTDAANLQQLASQPLSYNAKFNRISIHFLENHPGLTTDGMPGLPPNNCDTGDAAYAVQTLRGQSILISVCSVAYKLQPMLTDLTSPPDRAIDEDKDNFQGPQYDEGYGCENLGDYDSSWLDSVANTMLHELFHWPALFADVPNYAASILSQSSTPTDGVIPHTIQDFPGPDPAGGYGPWDAMQINRQSPADPRGLHWKGIYNAYNYIWYAVSKYFSRKCSRKFEECPSDEDSWRDRWAPVYPFPNEPQAS